MATVFDTSSTFETACVCAVIGGIAILGQDYGSLGLTYSISGLTYFQSAKMRDQPNFFPTLVFRFFVIAVVSVRLSSNVKYPSSTFQVPTYVRAKIKC